MAGDETDATKDQLEPASVVRQQPDVVTRTVAGETLLVPTRGDAARSERIYVLDEVGVSIWSRLDGRPLAEVVREVVAEYEVGEDVAWRDACELVTELIDAGIAELISAPAAP